MFLSWNSRNEEKHNLLEGQFLLFDFHVKAMFIGRIATLEQAGFKFSIL